MDVMVATYDVVENDFYFDPKTGFLSAIEAFADNESDPFELLMSDYVEMQSSDSEDKTVRKIPQLFTIRAGDVILGSYRVESIMLSQAEAEPDD